MARIEFTDNHQDLSTAHGFQFKFFCERCGNGYMSSWKANKSGIAGSILRGAGSVLGGLFGRAAAGSYEIQQAIGGPEHDHALEEAVEEIRPLFRQCKRCGQWLCEQVCWNPERNLCTQCAPVLHREVAARQATIAVEQAEERLRQQDQTRGADLDGPATVGCPACGAEVEGGKFCGECGARLDQTRHCAKCSATIKAGAKFCPECGVKAG